MKKNVLIIGAGGVAQVVAHKCAQHNDVLGDIHIASRTVDKCRAIIAVRPREEEPEDGLACSKHMRSTRWTSRRPKR